jgi:4-hydroxybenzoyl-CoA thioesterase
VRDGAEASAAVGAYSGGIHFFTPISIGDLVEIDARIVYTSARSAHVVSRVLTGDPRTPHERRLATLCMSVFVVPSPDGEALPVPQWLPELAEDVRLHTHARRILELRERIEPIPAGLTLEA